MERYTEQYDKAGEGKVNLEQLLKIIDARIIMPDTFEELIGAMKVQGGLKEFVWDAAAWLDFSERSFDR